MAITPDEVRHIARLARLNLTEEEVARFTRELSEIVDYIAQLNKLDTAGVVSRAWVRSENVLRDDEIAPYGDRRQILDNAPKLHGGQWQVPEVFS